MLAAVAANAPNAALRRVQPAAAPPRAGEGPPDAAAPPRLALLGRPDAPRGAGARIASSGGLGGEARALAGREGGREGARDGPGAGGRPGPRDLAGAEGRTPGAAAGRGPGSGAPSGAGSGAGAAMGSGVGAESLAARLVRLRMEGGASPAPTGGPSPARDDARDGAGAAARARPGELSEEARVAVERLAARDREVRAHEMAHTNAGRPWAGQPIYMYQMGPDGRRYAIGGFVPIDASPVRGDPRATVEKMRVVASAALAPAEPSAADRRIAAVARARMQEALAALNAPARETDPLAPPGARPASASAPPGASAPSSAPPSAEPAPIRI